MTSHPPPGAGMELKPTNADSERIFLTPRVVDRAAFEEFSSRLDSLITTASAQEVSLRAAGQEVASLAETLSAMVRDLRGTLENRPHAIDAAELRILVRDEVARATMIPPTAVIDEHGALNAHAALEDAAGEIIIRVTALARQAEAAGAAAQERIAELERIEQSARSTCTELGAALAQAERRAQTIATGLEASLVDAARRAEGLSPVVGSPIHEEDRLATLIRESTRVGDALARLIAQADAVGQALATLTSRATNHIPAASRPD
ncbi:MAG: hypothetical protein HBSAPP03_11300 [Phycisphaerae bacterium]|nr:MAG: hypothetical protein HBSAPP03_11300 [Phycisphaerae bacterium]